MARIGIIGTGIGGLTAGMALAHQGHSVVMFERAPEPGGKMRTFQTRAGLVDAGPTVLTLKHVFEQAFQNAGARLEDYVTLQKAEIVARHFWQDAPVLDFHADQDATIEAVTAWGGQSARDDFTAFLRDAALLFDAFEHPMMYSARPSLLKVTTKTLSNRRLFNLLSSGRSLESYLKKRFRDPKLAQLFGRYATYVGGMPGDVPMVLSLISKSEMDGVWAVKGGIHKLAHAMTDLIKARGGEIQFNTPVEDLRPSSNGLQVTAGDKTHSFDRVLFNGDPSALHRGLLGNGVRSAVPRQAVLPRALSANVWAFAAEPSRSDLAHHNVFFADQPNSEFGAIKHGTHAQDPTLYVCAQDRAAGPTSGPERFEIIMNAGATSALEPSPKEVAQCFTTCFQRLQTFGLTFTPQPDTNSLTTPEGFATLFPGSDGSLYGRSPSGMMSPFQRPTVRSRVKGLYLCGGGVHPGAGVPMASLSGQHAAAAILNDLTSTSTSRQMGMPGGISTA